MRIWLLAILPAWFCVGCAQPLPTYPWSGPAAALAIVSQRAQAVRTVRAPCDLTLVRADGQSVRLDAAVVMRVPGWLRVRAWKFGQAVFDLTLTPQGAWLTASQRMQGQNGPGEKVRLTAGQMDLGWSMFDGRFFTDPATAVEDHGGERFTLLRKTDRATLACEIDRSTLTVRRFTLTDTEGHVRFTLDLDDYQLISGIAWPTRFTANSDRGRVVARLREVEINAELPPQVFAPPAYAEKLP